MRFGGFCEKLARVDGFADPYSSPIDEYLNRLYEGPRRVEGEGEGEGEGQGQGLVGL